MDVPLSHFSDAKSLLKIKSPVFEFACVGRGRGLVKYPYYYYMSYEPCLCKMALKEGRGSKNLQTIVHIVYGWPKRYPHTKIIVQVQIAILNKLSNLGFYFDR